jgi:hypothetical protein
MAGHRNARVLAAGVCAGLALLASAIVRRAGAPPRDAAREAFLDERRARMRDARSRLLAPTLDRPS